MWCAQNKDYNIWGHIIIWYGSQPFEGMHQIHRRKNSFKKKIVCGNDIFIIILKENRKLYFLFVILNLNKNNGK